MPIATTTNTLTYTTIPAVDCWRLIYDNNKNILIFQEDTCSSVTANNVFCGTLQECEAQITSLGLVQTPITQTNPSILATLESTKEQIKSEAITFIKSNPTGTLEQFCTAFPWEQVALIQAVIYAYATAAARNSLITLAATDSDSCWAGLVQIVLNSTPEQLAQYLQ